MSESDGHIWFQARVLSIQVQELIDLLYKGWNGTSPCFPENHPSQLAWLGFPPRPPALTEFWVNTWMQKCLPLRGHRVENDRATRIQPGCLFKWCKGVKLSGRRTHAACFSFSFFHWPIKGKMKKKSCEKIKQPILFVFKYTKQTVRSDLPSKFSLTGRAQNKTLHCCAE